MPRRQKRTSVDLPNKLSERPTSTRRVVFTQQDLQHSDYPYLPSSAMHPSFVPYRVAGAYIAKRLQDEGIDNPEVGIICGSGLSELSKTLEGKTLTVRTKMCGGTPCVCYELASGSFILTYSYRRPCASSTDQIFRHSWLSKGNDRRWTQG